jgi:hypothetical protein
LNSDTVIGHQLLELLAGVLTATVGMMQQRIGLAPSPDHCAVIATLIDQPTTRRENRSITAAT